MNIKHKELDIPEDDPFKNCKLNRKPYAEALASIVEHYKDGFVMAINNEWGTGKTTFIKMWEQMLKARGLKTLYFNAWENDNHDNPLTAFMSEIKSLKGNNSSVNTKSLLEKGAIFAKSVLPTVAKAVAEKYIDTEAINEAIKNATEASAEIFKNEIDAYSKKKEGLKEFRKTLEKFISDTNDKKPVVFIIDELDRCKPRYAVEVLEQIKHLFSVPGIVFVLSIAKEQLINTIKGYYGTDLFNGEDYLKRFIDLEYQIPKPDNNLFIEYLFSYYGFGDFFNNPQRRNNRELSNDQRQFTDLLQQLLQDKNITLRQLEKFFAHTRLSLLMFNSESYLLPEVFVFLSYLLFFHPEVYQKIRTKAYSPQEFLDALPITYQNVNEEEFRIMQYLEARLVIMYITSLEGHALRDYITAKNGNYATILKSRMTNSGAEDEPFSVFLGYWYSNPTLKGIPITYITDKIDLTEHLK